MPVHHKKYSLEAGEELTPEDVCASLPHKRRVVPDKIQKSDNTKAAEKPRKNENSDA